MKELTVQIYTNEEGVNVVGSRVIAKELGKEHKHVRESIGKLLKEISRDFDPPQIIESEYKDNCNRTQKEYLLTKDGFTLYMFNIQGYNDFKMAYINKFNEMEKALQERVTPKQQLQLAILNGGEIERIQALKQYTDLIEKEVTAPLLDKIEQDKPLVAFADRVMNKGENILVRELAKIISDEGYSIGEKKLYKQLREWGYILKSSTEPTQRAIDSGYFVRITRVVNTPYGTKETFTTKVTPKGQIRITERILKENNL